MEPVDVQLYVMAHESCDAYALPMVMYLAAAPVCVVSNACMSLVVSMDGVVPGATSRVDLIVALPPIYASPLFTYRE